MADAESLDFAERWFADAFRVIETPGGFVALDVDMTRARALVEAARGRSVHATFNHLVVRAVALVLSRRPDLHLLVAGHRREKPSRVAIGLSVAGRSVYAPVMVIDDAAAKSTDALAEEITRRAPEVRAKEERDLASARRWGWLVPFSSWRRAILRWCFRRLWFRKALAGTFQVSCLAIDLVVPFLFTSAAALGVGRVRDRVVVVDGAPAVRPMLTLACCIDHKAWDGARAVSFLDEVRGLLESGEL
jgi:pyruvate/2-oxoglutarate dehydrogenase complex dihydrolipoamide acyltransferase (E2) component